MKKIVLASGSPRRKEILSKFNIDFDIITSDIDEKIREEEPRVVSMALAFEKAKDVSNRVNNESLVISADTIVVKNGEILGKPKSREEAKEMLLKLDGRFHKVITGMALFSNDKKVIAYEVTKVKFRDLDDSLIESYLDTQEYTDKAGSYGIQGLGSVLIEKIDGCYFNVMGLPVYKLDILLRENFDMKLL